VTAREWTLQRARQAVGGVIVMDQDRIACRIVRRRISAVRGTGADENGHQSRDAASGDARTKSLNQLALSLHSTVGSRVCQ
jgi:hypothetical protein